MQLDSIWMISFSLSGFVPQRSCVELLLQQFVLMHLLFLSLTLGPPADALGLLLFPNRFVLVAVLPVVTFCTLIGLFPDISDPLLLQQYLQIFALQHVDLRRLALQLVFPLEV